MSCRRFPTSMQKEQRSEQRRSIFLVSKHTENVSSFGGTKSMESAYFFSVSSKDLRMYHIQ